MSHLPRAELEALHSVLRRAAERSERRKRRGIPGNDNDPHADALARQVAEIEAELAGDRS